MLSTYAPQPLRILLAWPEPQAIALRQRLMAQASPPDVTCVPVNALGRYLSQPSYYHVLSVSPASWRELPSRIRQQAVAHVSLVVLAPEPASADDLAEVPISLTFRSAQRLLEVISTLARLQAGLSQGLTLSQCVEASAGQLAFAGVDACWPATVPIAQPVAHHPAEAHQQYVGVTPGIGIGAIDVQGDQVGSKVVFRATGDQTIRGMFTAGKIVQQSGGDQVNVNRIVDAPAGITQSAGEDQVNVNRIVDASTGTPQAHGEGAVTSACTLSAPTPAGCPACGARVEADYRFCQECGTKLR